MDQLTRVLLLPLSGKHPVVGTLRWIKWGSLEAEVYTELQGPTHERVLLIPHSG